MKAIETSFLGYRFRSRAEARWAVFFNTLGLDFVYEPEGFKLPVGRYLPDFFIPFRSQDGVYVEIKGGNPTFEERMKCRSLARKTGKPVYLLYSNPMNVVIKAIEFRPIRLFWITLFVRSSDWAKKRGKLPFADHQRLVDVFCNGQKRRTRQGLIEDAILAVRSARFEHGEKPAGRPD
ncbi:hypothetical protein [Thaumasiovibrio sp. DFM-14]|uniref:hypothetical protein n=1 Tax=Thaumasiovibrio sp. DFM-14 TaxID=3384792 RepID=UPI0039A39BDF